MKKLNNKIINSLKVSFLVILLFIGVALAADKTENTQFDLEEKGKVLVDKKSDPKNKESAKELETFTPTEKVSADQAVAFPSDI